MAYKNGENHIWLDGRPVAASQTINRGQMTWLKNDNTLVDDEASGQSAYPFGIAIEDTGALPVLTTSGLATPAGGGTSE